VIEGGREGGIDGGKQGKEREHALWWHKMEGWREGSRTYLVEAERHCADEGLYPGGGLREGGREGREGGGLERRKGICTQEMFVEKRSKNVKEAGRGKGGEEGGREGRASFTWKLEARSRRLTPLSSRTWISKVKYLWS